MMNSNETELFIENFNIFISWIEGCMFDYMFNDMIDYCPNFEDVYNKLKELHLLNIRLCINNKEYKSISDNV